MKPAKKRAQAARLLSDSLDMMREVQTILKTAFRLSNAGKAHQARKELHIGYVLANEIAAKAKTAKAKGLPSVVIKRLNEGAQEVTTALLAASADIDAKLG